MSGFLIRCRQYSIWVAILILLNACSNLSSNDCKQANWHDVGKTDAIKGQAWRFNEYKKVCASVEIVPSEIEYHEGFTEGVREHCTYDVGYKLGLHGGRAEDSCINVLDYGKGYVKGVDEYVERVNRDKIERLTRPRSSASTITNN